MKSAMATLLGVFPVWIFRELLGVFLLLGAIVYLPVAVSKRFAIQEIPFQTQTAPRESIRLFPSRGEVRAAIVNSVERQLEALRIRDFDTAWQLASRGLRRHLPLADFERMVSTGFAVMVENHQVEIGAVFCNREVAFVDVKLIGENLGEAYFGYFLEARPEGWFVAGVDTLSVDQFEGRRGMVPAATERDAG